MDPSSEIISSNVELLDPQSHSTGVREEGEPFLAAPLTLPEVWSTSLLSAPYLSQCVKPSIYAYVLTCHSPIIRLVQTLLLAYGSEVAGG